MYSKRNKRWRCGCKQTFNTKEDYELHQEKYCPDKNNDENEGQGQGFFGRNTALSAAMVLGVF